MLIKTIGFLAGLLTTVSFLPQVIKTYQTKHAEDFNLLFLVLFLCGITLWLVYGIMIHEWPIILANGVTIVLNFILLGMKMKYKKK
ncbi:SemiSWEET transporter [candidate division TA06 bacterium]|nr:SemiSWEET transporter [candidate division TA06 bacterium]